MADAPTFTTELAPAYVKRRETMMTIFPAAHGFLIGLERLAGAGGRGYHLATSDNVHLYLDRRFLAHVRLELAVPEAPRLSLLAKPKLGLKVGTGDGSNMFFGSRLERLIAKHDGFKMGWTEKNGKNGDRERVFSAAAPSEFFHDLLTAIGELPR